MIFYSHTRRWQSRDAGALVYTGLGFKTCLSKTKTKIKTLGSKTKTPRFKIKTKTKTQQFQDQDQDQDFDVQDQDRDSRLTRPILEVHDCDKQKDWKSHGKQKIQHTGSCTQRPRLVKTGLETYWDQDSSLGNSKSRLEFASEHDTVMYIV